jgi:hypothetical protein
MKRVWTVSLVAIVALSVVVMMALPASAVGAGEVDGTVGNITPGITTTATLQTYQFNPIELAGVFANGTNVAVGQVTTSTVSGGSTTPESITGGAGTVGNFTFSSTGVHQGTASGSCSGTYTRTVSIVLVSLNCTLSVNGGASVPAHVDVRAQFTPTSGNGITSPITAANFFGEFNL